MPRELPEGCRRDDPDCMALSCIVSDEQDSYVCFGRVKEPGCDPWRLCFVTPTTNTRYDHDDCDLFDMMEVIVRGMSTWQRYDG